MSQGLDTLQRDLRRPLTPVRPIGEGELFFLFQAMIRFPGFFHEVQPRLALEQFDAVHEAHWRLLYMALVTCHKTYGGAGYETVAAVIDRLIADRAVQLTQEQYDALTAPSMSGIMYAAYACPSDWLTSDTLPLAHEILQRLLVERSIVFSLRRLVNTGFSTPGAYPEELGTYLSALADQYRQLSTTEAVPTVIIAPAPGTQLQPATQYVPTGLTWFDSRFTGQRRGDVNGIVGVTGGGKTTLACHMVVTQGRSFFQHAGGHACEQVALVTYEEPVRRLRPRLQAAAFSIPRETLETIRDPSELARSPQDYERGMYAANGRTATPCEYERYMMGMEWLNSAVVAFDFSGSDDHPLVGQGYVDEIATALQRNADMTGRGYGSVYIDYAGLACDRHAAVREREIELRHLLRNFGMECKRKIADKFNCTVWVLHQIRGDACNRSPTALLHHNDAAESKSFAEHLSLCACIGSVDHHSGIRLINFSKVRYRPAERIQPALFRIHEHFATIEDMSEIMALDESGTRLVSREDLAQIEGRERNRQPNAGPTGLNQAVRTQNVRTEGALSPVPGAGGV